MSRGASSISSSERRAWLSGAGLLLLGACGFRPVHGVARGDADAPGLAEELAAVRVPLIAERFGQLVRRGIEQRLVIGATPSPTLRPVVRHELRVNAFIQIEAVGIGREGASSRLRSTGTARWALVRIGPPEEAVASGFERSLDASNLPLNQFFAGDASREATERRMAESLAQEVVTRVALALRRQLAAGV